MMDEKARETLAEDVKRRCEDAGLKPDKNFSALIQRARMLHFSGIERKSALRQVLSEAQNMQENLQK